MKTRFTELFISLAMFFAMSAASLPNGLLIPTDSTQPDFLKAYKFALYYSYADYRFSGTTLDSILFPKYGEFSIYWAKSGPDKGSFVYPDKALPTDYLALTRSEYNSYNWQNLEHYSIQFKLNTKNIAIFRSLLKVNNNTISWASLYFKNTFDSYLFNNMYYFTDEKDIDTAGINGAAQLLIIPPFNVRDTDNKFYIDSIFKKYPGIKQKLDAFLASGGMIYAEGNASYFIERLGYLPAGTIDYKNTTDANHSTNMLRIKFTGVSNPVSFTQASAGDSIFATSVPKLNLSVGESIAEMTNGNPVVFALKGKDANGGKIIVNTALPTAGGINNLKKGSRQLAWTMNAIMWAFTKNIDVTRSEYNDLPDSLTAGKNAIAYDAADTFEIRIKIRNLSSQTITGLQITEYFRDYFKFVDVATPGVQSSVNGSTLVLSNITLAPLSETVIVYRLRTPDPTDPIHEKINNYISWANYIYTSYMVVNCIDADGTNVFVKYRDYVDVMFSAKLVVDTDLNWKNILYLNYQPFKVFMIMENKERTPAVQTKYTAFIPKDVPFYWTDSKINIPILRTPGGKYVDILKGSNNEGIPEFDQDGDGHPDVWLDTASIYPKGYTITEDSVYWLNPWEHLRSGDTLFYEDINHDGKRPYDLNGDGIVDIESPGDKIRVWKVTWDIGKVNGYDYFDPYCYYEIWLDPPDLVPMSAGVGFAYNLCDSVPGMFYPYSKDVKTADLADTSWTHWMERDNNGNVIWKQMIYQRIHNYEGFTFIDTLKENYHLLGTDKCVGTVPQPHREFIAVLSLGGEEIDMTKPTPNKSNYSNLEYRTIFNEKRVTPIRTTYTYYAPLPNPLQFEYLSNNFLITDPATGNRMQYLPEWGKANLTFDMDASTEYSYYWIRNAGKDVMYNDPSLKIDGIDSLGDGVFGYMIYDIPKGLGGYSITLPKKADGTYDIDKIVQVDGHNFEKWIDNPNTKNEVEIWEDQFQYHVYIPQILIPPALDDDNFDGVDDWIDDRGDRFCSSTGFLHDMFMPGNGEDYLSWPKVPFKDDIYGMVTKGWFPGADSTYGDDFFENLGKTHIKINAVYEGKGKEGPIDISKGGWLVVEEIFGGSPWVIFSHTLSGFSKGTDLRINSKPVPSIVRYGVDTTYIKHTIDDANEPHNFNSDFDPYHVSFGYGESTVTTDVGGKDPCSLVTPAINTSSIIDPNTNHTTVTLVPMADNTNPDLADYPKQVTGTFTEIKIEVMNGTDDNWINTTITPIIPPELGNSKVIMSYVAYPRPLVPAQADPSTGKIIHTGDQLGTFTAGWRFNQPEGEVLVKMGNTLNLMQPSRRAYYVFLVSIDESIPKGVYKIDFTMSGERKHYDGTVKGSNNFAVPSAYFSISSRDSKGNVSEYQKIVIGTADLTNINTTCTKNFTGNQNTKWSKQDITNLNFDTLATSLPTKYDAVKGIETVDLSQFKNFPSVSVPRIYALEQGTVSTSNFEDVVDVTTKEELNYNDQTAGALTKNYGKLSVNTFGPKMREYKYIYSVNGQRVINKDSIVFDNKVKDIVVALVLANYGNDLAENSKLAVSHGELFVPLTDSLPQYCTYSNNLIQVDAGSFIPGESKTFFLHLTNTDNCCGQLYTKTNLITSLDANYLGNSRTGKGKEIFAIPDKTILGCPAVDLFMQPIKSSEPLLIHGTATTITASYQNGVLPVQDVYVRMFAVQNTLDTLFLGEKLIPSMAPMEQGTFDVTYQIPDSASYIEFFAKIDGNNQIPEFCETNNSAYVYIPLKDPDWIINPTNAPNPFDNTTDFYYILPKDVQSVTITVFTLDGKQISRLENCGTSVGQHRETWLVPDTPKGTYIYDIQGIRPDGSIVHHYGKLIKDK